MESVIFLLLAMAISCGSFISASPLQQADMIHKNGDKLLSEANLAMTATKSSGNLISPPSKSSIVEVANTSPPSINKNVEAPQQKRFRRSYGYRTQCIPVEKMKCQIFKVNNIEKNFCVMYTEYICTALD